MDPAAYARAHGIQSESNKVTVTRVACGEIMYRRAVDTYRRDMKYKLNNLRKEQKRLRVCMRDYRRKLQSHTHREENRNRDDKQSDHKDNCFSESGNTADNLTVSHNEGFDISKGGRLGLKNNAASAPVDGYNTHKIMNKNESALSQDPASPAYLDFHQSSTQTDTLLINELQRKQGREDVKKNIPKMIANVGRTARKGSGKIGVLSRQVHVSVADSELEADAFSDASDSSDEAERNKDRDDPIDIVSFRNGRFVREITPLTLMKSKGAYFKPTSSEMDYHTKDIYENNYSDITRTTIADKPENDSHEDTTCSKEEDRDTANKLALPPSCTHSLRSLPVGTNQNISRTSPKTGNKVDTDDLKNVRKKKEKPAVSFNDIIKLQVSNNTKMLFALVDRLAKNNGIPLTPEQRKATEHLTRNDPREYAIMMRRAQAAKQGKGTSTLTPHGSVYYTIKYGYFSDKDEDKHRPKLSSTTSLEKSATITTDPASASLNSNNASEIMGSPNATSVLSLNQGDTTQPTPTLLLEKTNNELQLAVSSTDDSSQTFSFISDRKVKQREKRKSSLLEASKFISAARGKKNMTNSEILEQVRREKDLFNRPRRDSTKPEHVEVSHKHREAWHSAFRRIKIIHTLADLTHII
ncbi:hypothetical protein PoB_007128200 [Plakobranchus ocellatus]|uniref:Uncharacterized protein n=1 Tax=Plakobranchus ocellatus TaxID=259542 RepID=A0AAV4DKH1_9GAST|nr:hypothetical protein PoB_007128200 [Plakobranchus ocellatus]